jgi:hypothetical protein
MIGKNAVENFKAEDILDSIGLMRKSEQISWLWPAVGGLGLGLLCGVALGVAFAPRKGSELRDDIAKKIRNRDYTGLGETARSAMNSSTTMAHGTSGRGGASI